jgi:hypothetical protein
MNLYTLLFGGWAGWLLLKSINQDADKSTTTTTTSTPVTSTPVTSRPITPTLLPFHPSTQTPIPGAPATSTPVSLHPKSTQITIPGVSPTKYRRPPNPVGAPVSPNLEYLLSESSEVDDIQVLQAALPPQKPKALITGAGVENQRKYRIVVSQLTALFTDPTRTPKDLEIIAVHLKLAENALNPQATLTLPYTRGPYTFKFITNHRHYKIYARHTTATGEHSGWEVHGWFPDGDSKELMRSATVNWNVSDVMAAIDGWYDEMSAAGQTHPLAGKSSRSRHVQNLGGLKSWSRHGIMSRHEARRNAELREITMAKKQAGARVDLHQEIKPTRGSQILTTDTLRKSDFVPADSVNSNIGSALLKTRDAMGRLLG